MCWLRIKRIGGLSRSWPRRARQNEISIASIVINMLSIGHASSQRVKRSMHVRKYQQLLDENSGPIRSPCMCPKRRSDGAKDIIGETVCLNTFVHWHGIQHILVLCFICLSIPGQQYLDLIKRKVALPPPCAYSSSPLNTDHLSFVEISK